MKKKILSILLAICMAMCLLPTGVFADGKAFTAFGSDGNNGDGKVIDTAYNTAAQKLDNDYGYTEYDLGANIIGNGKDEKMRFRFWSPTASQVKVNIFQCGTDDEQGATKIAAYTLKKLYENGKWTGVWEITLTGNWHSLYYTYSVTDADTGNTKDIADPYSRQFGRDGKRSYTIDFDHYSFKPEGWDGDSHVYFDSAKSRCVYRLDVASFTKDSSANVKNSGKFLGLTEAGTHYDDISDNPSTGLDYIKQLGVTAVELDGVCDAENAFALNLQCATDQQSAVSELRQMIKVLHSAGLAVIIKLPAGFVELNNGTFDNAVPNYYFRLNEAGEKLDGSGFGNELASERLMYRNWLITTLLGWVNEYHIDGFSFEQSALIDSDTLSAAINAVSSVDNRIAFFADGECKTKNSHPSTVCTGETFRRSTNANSAYLPSALIFEERSGKSLYAEICESLGVSSDQRNETAVKKAKFAAGLLAVSSRILYIDAGEEICAPELGRNVFEWKNIATYFDVFSYYRGLLQLRNTFPYFSSSETQFKRGNILSASSSGNILVTGHEANDWQTVSISYNATDKQTKEVALCDLRDWDIVASADFAGIDSHDKLPESANNYFVLEPYSLKVAVDSSSFASAGFSSGMETLTLEFINEETKEKLMPDMLLTGKSGEGFILPNSGKPRLGNGYELHKTSSPVNGKFGETTKVTFEYGYIFDGIEDGGEYCSPAEFKLKGINGVTKVKSNGATLTPNGETYTLAGSGEQTVTVETGNGIHTIKVKLRSDHTYQFITENGMYYKKCSACGQTTSPQAIPSVEITAPERVCAGQDCIVTVGTLPSGVTIENGLYEFEFIGADFEIAEKNGVWSGTVSHDWYQPDENKFDVCLVLKNADGYIFTVRKTVNVLAEHTGGTATCTEKAKCEVCGESYGALDASNHTGTAEWFRNAQGHEKKYTCCGVVIVANETHEWQNGVCGECGYVCLHDDTDKNHVCDYCEKVISDHEDADKNHICDYCGKVITNHTGGKATCAEKAICELCGKAYGELNASNHTNLVSFPAKAATTNAEGNIEYWRCEGCGKYFADSAGTKEITAKDTVTGKLPNDKKSPQTGDGNSFTLWIALLFISGSVFTAVTVKRKKSYQHGGNAK